MQNVQSNKGIFLSLDWMTIGIYVAMVVWGWFSVCGASYDFNNPDVLSFSTNSGKQLVWIGTSMALGCMILFVEKRFFDTSAFFIYTMMILLLLVTIFIAPDTKGSRSWLPLGPVKLQPAEFAKFSVALALAKLMDRYGFNMRDYHDFLKAVGLVVLPMVLIVCQKETGSALAYLAFFLVLYREGMTGSLLFTAFASIVYFVVGVRYSDDFLPKMPVSIGEYSVLMLAQLFTTGMTWVFTRDKTALRIMVYAGIGTSLLALLFSIFVIPFNVCHVMLVVCIAMILYLFCLAIYQRCYRYAFIALFGILSTGIYYVTDFAMDHFADHQRVRIEVLLGKKEDARGAGYNVNQAKIAIGSGGLIGKGFLNGTQTKLKYVPEQDTDFIFCTVGEEEGFLGAAGVLIAYLIFIWRLITLAERQPDTLGRVYGYSVCCIFLFHLFINVGMVLGLTPVIGIPLPFFSYGGSSLWGFTIMLFIFLRMDAERNWKRQ